MQPPSPFPIFPRYEQYLAEVAVFPASLHVRSRLEALDSRCEPFECCRYASTFLQSKMVERPDFGAGNYQPYARNLDRLLNWSFVIARKSFFEWDEVDVKNYMHFLCDPPADWTASKRYPRFITDYATSPDQWRFNPGWRPFYRAPGRPAERPVYRTLERSRQVLVDFFKYIALHPPSSHAGFTTPITIDVPPLEVVLAKQIEPDRIDASENLDERELDWVFDQFGRLANDDDEREIMLLCLANARYTSIPFRSLTRERDCAGYLSQFQRRCDGSWVFVERSGMKNERIRPLDAAFTPYLERYLKHLEIDHRVSLPDTHILMRRGAHQGMCSDRIFQMMEGYRRLMLEEVCGEFSTTAPSASKLATLTLSRIRRSAKACVKNSLS